MDAERFAGLTEQDIASFLESDSFEFSREEALKCDLPLSSDRKRDVRPRSVLPVKEYLDQGGPHVTDSGRILLEIGDYDSREDAPRISKRRIGALLNMGADSDHVPIENWGSTSYQLNFEDDDLEELLDYSRITFIDKCMDILSGKENSEAARHLPEHLDSIEERRWEALKTADYWDQGEEFYEYNESSFRGTNPFTDERKNGDAGKSFIAYHIGLNNLRETEEGYLLNAAPEEIELSRKVAEYVRDRHEQTPVQ